MLRFCGMQCFDVSAGKEKTHRNGAFLINELQNCLFLLIGEIIAARSLEVFLVTSSTVVKGLF